MQVVTEQKDSTGNVLNEPKYDVYDLDYKLKPSSSYDEYSGITTTVYTVLKNSFTKLKIGGNTTPATINLYGYNNGWKLINSLEYPSNISLIKPILIRHDEIVIQVNNTKIHITKLPMFSIYHPQTDINFVETEYYFHDNKLETCKDIVAKDKGKLSMTDIKTGYYTECYNSLDHDSILVIGKKDPCNIYVDHLPADGITGIGWVTHTIDMYNRGDYMVLSWYSQTRTGSKFKQLV